MKETPIIWITLKRNKNRHVWFEENNIRRFPQLKFLRFYGVDALDHGIVRARHDLTADGQLGCWLSHWMVWQLIVSHGWEQTVVMEDDARLLDDPTQTPYEKNCFTYLGDSFNGHFNRGTWAYRITLGVAIWFLENISRPTSNIDHEIFNSPVEKVVSNPVLAEHPHIDESDTTPSAQKRLESRRLLESIDDARKLFLGERINTIATT